MKKILLLALFVVLAQVGYSQTLASYGFTAFSGTYTSIGGTVAPLTGGTGYDDGYSNTIPIGFTFTYCGVAYTDCSIDWNGWIVLGSTITGGETTWINDLSDAHAYHLPRPILAALWTDLYFAAASQITYQTAGAVGSRTFTVQWNNSGFYSSITPRENVQIVLYEGSNIIDFKYGDLASGTYSSGCSIGITGGSGAAVTGAVPYWSLSDASATPGRSMTVETTTIGTQPATNQVYRWSPCNSGSVTGTAKVCAGSTTTLGDAVTGGTWSSGTTTVATVGSSSGVVTGVAGGTSNITYTSSVGCYTVAVVTVNPVPVTITGSMNVCVGLTSTLTDASGGGTWVSSTTSVATIGSSSGVVTGGSTTGTSTITYTISSTGCYTVATVTVNPQPAVITGTLSVCAGSTTNLTDATGSGTWTSTGTATVSATGVVTGVSAGTATITYSIAGGCFATAVVTVNPQPTAISGNAPICQTFTETLTDAIGGGVWSSVTTSVATISSTGLVTGAGVGTSVISYTIGSCYATTVVTVNTQPGAISGTFSLCEGSSTLLTDATAGGTWSSVTTTVATISTGGTVTASSTTTGTSIISYAIGSCVATQIVTVTTLPAIITGNAPVCQGFTENLTDATAGGTWSSVTTTVATISSTGVVTGAGVGTSVVSYTIGTCAATVIVTVNTQPAAISGTFSLCEGASTLLTDATAGGTWSSVTTTVATIGTDGTVTASTTTAGTSTISYTIGSCVATKIVTVNTQPAVINGNAPICQTFTENLTDATGGGVWSSVTTTVATISSTGLVTGAGVGTSVVSYTIGSCVSTVVVTVNTQPAAISGAFALCEGSSTLLTDATTGGTWTSVTTTVATIGTDGTVTASSTTTGTSIISYTIGSCVATKIVTVTTQPAAITGNAPICQTFTENLSDATGGGVWSSVTTTVATISSTGVVTGAGVGTSVVSYTIGSCAATVIVTVNTQPTAILGAPSVCRGFTTSLNDATGGGTWSSVNTVVATIASTGIVTGATVGTSLISYTIGSCVANVVVTVTTTPAAINGNAPICMGATENLTDATGGGTWSSITTTVATISSTGVVTGAGVGTSVVSYTIGSCAASTIVTVNIQPTAILGTLTVCQGLTTSLSDATGAGVWSSIPVTTATILGSGVATGVAAGTATISYTIGSCAATAILTVNSLPSGITGTKTVCSGLTTTLFDAGTGTWTSSNTGVATVGLTTGVVTGGVVAVATTVTITYTLGTGCITTTVVTVNPLPTAILGPNNVCFGSSVTLSDAGGGTWLSQNTGIATVGSSTGVVNGTGVGVTTITYTLPTGCLITMPFTVNPLPVGITGPNLVCVGSTITLSDLTGLGTWSSSNTAWATVGVGTGVVTGVAGGVVTISYIVGTGCYATYPVTVDAQLAVITPVGDTTFCPGGFVALTANVGAGLTYQWYVGGAAIGGAVASSYIATTSGSYQVQVTNTAGCSTLSIPMLVTVDTAVATITASTSTTICSGSSATLDANTGVGLSYQWLQDGGAIAGATASSYTTTLAGDYSVIITNATGCSATSNVITISVNPSPTANIVLSGPLTFCQGDSVVMTTDYSADYSYQWYNGAGAITGANGVSYTATTTGNYYVTVSNSYGCSATSIVMSVVANPLPNVGITASGSTLFCTGGSVTLSATAVAGDLYQWYLGGFAITGATNASYLATVGGGYRVQVTDPTTGCSDETHADTVVTVVGTPVVVPVTPASFCWGGSSLLSTSVSGASGTITYQWYFNGVAIPGANAALYNATVPGNYSCLITIPGSCSSMTVAIPVTEFPLPNPLITFDGSWFHTGTYYVAYQWYKDMVAIPGATGSGTPSMGAGNYKVAVTDTNGCQSYSDIYVYTGNVNTTGVQNVSGSDIKIYPNPAQTMVHIESGVQVRVTINAIDGRSVLNIQDAKDIDISALADGVYLVMVYDTNGQLLKIDKLVKAAN